jgi:nicotinamidase/pyrazinamidase
MNALILVDIQNDFLPGGPLAVPAGDEVIPAANRAQSLFDVVAATKDWHPPGHVSFAASHAGRKPGEVVQCEGVEQLLWPEHCVQNTPGAEFPRGLNVARSAKVFPKGTDPKIDSYSGFFDNGRRKATGLNDYLRQRGVSDVYVMGLATDYCVKHTALDACELGFRVFLLEDGCRAVNLSPDDAEQAVKEMQAAGVALLTIADLRRP